MKITYYGTAASEAWPALFCRCHACEMARKYKGKNIRTRSQTLIDKSLLIDFPPDTNYHSQYLGLDLAEVRTLLITHSHHDHFFPYDICMRNVNYAEKLSEEKLHMYGSEVIRKCFEEAAVICKDTEKYIAFHTMSAFETIQTADGYHVTALLADHNQPEEALIYMIEKSGKRVLYAHDTGIFPESTWNYIKNIHFDLVSLDCTALSRNWRKGHMGFEAADEVKKQLGVIGCTNKDTVFVLSHMAHFGDFTHDKICKLEEPKGYVVAYDGYSCNI